MGIALWRIPFLFRISGGRKGGRTDNAPGTWRLRGRYLYDKGENDERIFVQISSGTRPRSIYRHIVLYSDKKVNTFFKLFQKSFFLFESNILWMNIYKMAVRKEKRAVDAYPCAMAPLCKGSCHAEHDWGIVWGFVAFFRWKNATSDLRKRFNGETTACARSAAPLNRGFPSLFVPTGQSSLPFLLMLRIS